MNDLFIYTSNTKQYSSQKEYLAYIPSIKDKDQLLNELSLSLNFPDYFGHNWDALDECINDFHWIKDKKITLVHESIPDLKLSDLKIYIDILNDAVFQWKTSNEHILKIIFPKSCENLVSAILWEAD